MYFPDLYADVTELADGPDLGSGALICVWVRLPSSAPRGVAKSVKASAFDADIQRFESVHPRQLKMLWFLAIASLILE